ncbi:2-phosphoxylose phosphatase 1 isoform X1 [Diprion similis]|uniref:2-phosphoxylose phosphatase 1 isoform X1 n=2 Tax=Diprion similis TaxID=362088 RepID=UPI001EF80454|nr:2-phosphoxylose phosphatase 1 isoform X1 [Diprion similis]
MLPEMLRLSYQHRAFYCYVILSVWIFLLVAGMYKYIGVDEKTYTQGRRPPSDISLREFPRNLKLDLKTKKIFRFCNSPDDINPGAEGKVDGNLTLEGILVFIRHGDRGPLTHVRNITTVNCAKDFSGTSEMESVYLAYQSFLQNVSSYSRTAWTQFLGPFHGFPMLPADSKECKLAQLTGLGVNQLLKTGLLLRNIYYNKLNLNSSTLNSKDIIVYSTRYRRTVQSAVALLYTFLEYDNFGNLAKINLQESQSLTFCNTDCACSAADKFSKQHSKEMAEHLRSHPAVANLIKQAGNVVFEMPEQAQSTDPNSLRDALLTYVCHNAPLPCIDLEVQQFCVKTEHVTSLFAYTEWEAKQHAKSRSQRKYGLLRAYGLLRDIVSHMLRIVSDAKPKVVLYSGHDKTLEYLATALGLVTDRFSMSHYASRFIIEVYKMNPKNENHVASDFYFRVVINGKDFTQDIPFCKNVNYFSVNVHNRPDKIDKIKAETKLCPIEAIIRQLHDDYFAPFNATNFKDACSIRKHG